MRHHMVKEHARNIAFCPTGINKADPLTKPMANPLMVYHNAQVGI